MRPRDNHARGDDGVAMGDLRIHTLTVKVQPRPNVHAGATPSRARRPRTAGRRPQPRSNLPPNPRAQERRSSRTQPLMSGFSPATPAPHRSLWLEQALDDGPDAAPLAESTTADVCIIGGGFVGLWTAWWIKQLGS